MQIICAHNNSDTLKYDSLKAVGQVQFEEGASAGGEEDRVTTEKMMRQKMMMEQTVRETNRTQEECVNTVPELKKKQCTHTHTRAPAHTTKMLISGNSQWHQHGKVVAVGPNYMHC